MKRRLIGILTFVVLAGAGALLLLLSRERPPSGSADHRQPSVDPSAAAERAAFERRIEHLNSELALRDRELAAIKAAGEAADGIVPEDATFPEENFVFNVNRPGSVDPETGEFIPLQSEARPHGMEPVTPVRAAASDPRSQAFRDDVLPEINRFLSGEDYVEALENSIVATPEVLTLAESGDVRVYFVGSESGAHNSIGISAAGAGGQAERRLLFPNAKSDTGPFKTVSDAAPLQSGDFVDLGVQSGGSLLDLFVVADGARNPQGRILGSDPATNPDGKSNVRIYGAVDDSILIVGFEDTPGGGDQDFQDVVLAVEVGPGNVRAILNSGKLP